MAGAQIRLLEDGRIKPVLSDEAGAFRLEDVFAGDYTLHVYQPDYEIATSPIRAVMDSLNPVAIELQPFVPYETELGYDDGIGEDAVSLSGTGVGYGTVFEPESFAHVKAVRAFFWGPEFPNPGGDEISLVIMKANDQRIPVDEKYFEPISVTVRRGEWNTFDISDLNIHTDEPFIATFIQTQTGNYSPAIGIDNQAVTDNQHSYLYVGESFKPIRQEGITGSWMIRTVVDYSISTPTIDGTDVDYNEDGQFSHSMILSQGVNHIELIARDKAGNETLRPLQLICDTSGGGGEIHRVFPETDKTYYAGDEITFRIESDITGASAAYALALPRLQTDSGRI